MVNALYLFVLVAGLSLTCLLSRDAIMVVVIRKGENLQQLEDDGKHYMYNVLKKITFTSLYVNKM